MTGSKYFKVFLDGGENCVSISHSFSLTMIPLLTMEVASKCFSLFFFKLRTTPFLDQLLRIRHQLVGYAKFENILIHLC